ncbi:unnamed protein product [Lactuca virosa]|uniref:Uncharacterized protein n=1 Tax=Lactuca virosa TaxID=75947 RepID=A0AAU9LNY8_9ASTR|nr:unnamed protein product [Lactuca virosa]
MVFLVLFHFLSGFIFIFFCKYELTATFFFPGIHCNISQHMDKNHKKVHYLTDSHEQEYHKEKECYFENEVSSQEEKPGTKLIMAEVNEVDEKDASFEGNNNAALTIDTGLKYPHFLKIFNVTFEVGQNCHHSAHEFNIQCFENAPHSGPSFDAPVNLPACRRLSTAAIEPVPEDWTVCQL